MVARRHAACLGILVAVSLGGCSRTIGLYHDVEGGAIAQHRQPPPGANLPYPNLADVPAAQAPAKPGEQAIIAAQAGGGVSAPSSGALAGLALPASPPPLPVIAGLTLASGMAVASPAPVQKPVMPQPPLVTKPKPSAQVALIAFRPNSALLVYSQLLAVQIIASKRGEARVRVCGFGDGSLELALMRARRLANALTADGTPADKIDIVAYAVGSGGFIQLVY